MKIKERVELMIAYGEKATEHWGPVIAECDEMRLTYNLRDIYKAHGAAEILSRMYPEDEDVKKLWRQALDLYKLGNNFRDRFSKECICKKLLTV